MITELKYSKELERLRSEHDSLESEISNLMRLKIIDQFRLLSLKKKKLRVKESISMLNSILYKDLTA